jgi:hypothetical protein
MQGKGREGKERGKWRGVRSMRVAGRGSGMMDVKSDAATPVRGNTRSRDWIRAYLLSF